MKVKLLQNIVEKDKDDKEIGLKVAKRRNREWFPPRKNKDGEFEECLEPQFIYTPFVPGTVIECSEATGEKYIENGWAEEVVEEKETEEE